MRPAGCILVFISVVTGARAQEYLEDFETGAGGAYSYYQAPDDMKIERCAGQAASGNWYLRGALPGQQALEGLALTATGLTGGRLATVTARQSLRPGSAGRCGERWTCDQGSRPSTAADPSAALHARPAPGELISGLDHAGRRTQLRSTLPVRRRFP